ncbi:MAG: hypothetical protein C4323_01305 [Mastigocladus sp. ERB_26_2]
MEEKIAIRPHKYLQFGSTQECNFYLVTEVDLVNAFTLEQENSYKSYQILTYTGGSLTEVIQQTQEPAHILVICPKHYICALESEQLGLRKLAIMAVNSTPTSWGAIAHFLSVMEATDPEVQRAFANHFFDTVEQAEYLHIIDERYQTSAKFFHLADEYEWFEQGGFLDWGQQQIVPSGELSVLPLTHGKFSPECRLEMNGELAFWGYPILHSGKDFSRRTEQAYIYEQLAILKEHAVIATVENGAIAKLQATHPSVEAAKSALEHLFTVDSHYQLIWEVGFGINTALKLWPGNNAMNEVYGAEYGAIHWGFGLTTCTPYHLDIICPNSQVLTHTGEFLIGGNSGDFATNHKQDIVRNSAIACPCISY